jgi:hypothetical protein
MGNCSCKKKEEGDELKMEEPLNSKSGIVNQSAGENGLSIQIVSKDDNMPENSALSSRNQSRPLTNSNSVENLHVEIREDDKYILLI